MITIIVAVYNPDWKKLRATLISILHQKNIQFEIIIADDGSEYNHKDEIIELFDDYSFVDYSFSILPANKGTCWNIYNALMLAKYDYIKPLSPGDLLYDDYTLSEWYRFSNENCAEVCFGESVFYDGETHNILNNIHNPRFLGPYELGKISTQRKNYLLIPDPVLGASIVMKKAVAINNVTKILNHVIYCEDYFLKFYILNGGRIFYYNRKVLWYEYGLGISTNPKWNELIKKDKIECAKILIDEKESNWRWRLVWRHQIGTGNLPKYRFLLFPSVVPYAITKKQFATHKYKFNDVEKEMLEFFFLNREEN